jgi:hypothetical protein
VTDIAEDDIDFTLLKWHYSKYPKTTSTWRVLKISGEADVYQANFVFESYSTIVLYTAKGAIIEEEVNLSENVPVSILAYLDDLYSKYKVTSFIRKINYKAKNEVIFTVELKSKEKGIERIDFDYNLIPLNSHLVSESN